MTGAQEKAGLSLFYSLQQTEPAPEDVARLETFLKEKLPAGGAVLVQGFGCDTGGYERSLFIATQRGRRAVDRVKAAGIAGDAVLLARPIVFYGGQRVRHRRVRFSLFQDPAAARAARTRADTRARQVNADTEQKLKADEEAEAARQAAEAEVERKAAEAEEARAAAARETNGGENEAGAAADRKRPGAEVVDSLENGVATAVGEKRAEEVPRKMYRLLVVVALLIVLVLLYLLYERYEIQRKRTAHQLTAEEAEALEVLTGGAVMPVAPAPSAKKTAKIASKISRSLPTMAKKKAKKQVTPLNIQGAVDKAFEGQTLNQIRKAPIHALEGLTPRHAMLLKEGFGIDTIEDLAKLKYFEIAKAITVLAKYEK